jgi:hypothetical protein
MVVADDAVSDTGSVVSASLTLLSVLFSVSGSMVAAAAGVEVDAVTDALVGGEVSSDCANLGTDGVGGADFTSLLVLYVFSCTKIAAAAGTAADAVAGTSVGVGMSLNDASQIRGIKINVLR